MCSCHSIPECCVMFSGVKLSMRSFVLFMKKQLPVKMPWKAKPLVLLGSKCKSAVMV